MAASSSRRTTAIEPGDASFRKPSGESWKLADEDSCGGDAIVQSYDEAATLHDQLGVAMSVLRRNDEDEMAQTPHRQEPNRLWTRTAPLGEVSPLAS